VTAFAYGLSTGLAAALATDATANTGAALMVGGALTYTGLSLAFVNTDRVDRGDLPLTLAIGSYAPLTTALAALATGWSAPKAVGAAVTASAVVAIPVAYLVAKHTDLDPGDTQLVRDVAFWGLGTGFVAGLGLTDSFQSAARAGLAGLYGGLALGLVAATHSDVSLERVRMTTWGGYGGALTAGLVAVAAHADSRSGSLAVVGGAALGLLTTFLATRPTDALAPNALPTRLSLLTPTVLPVQSPEGHPTVRPGITLAAGRF
jgi:hypothetical protein